MSEQKPLDLEETGGVDSVEKYKFEPIKGYPMLHWHGKRPFTSTQYYPAQKKEVYGEEVDGWINKIFWGDNLQVMSHLLREYRGRVQAIYIDPPFDSKADYKKRIKIKGKKYEGDTSSFEEKQYTDIWTNDEYLQFMYERIVLLRELLSESGTLIVHCDQSKGHLLRCLLDEVFGEKNFLNEVVWDYRRWPTPAPEYQKMHDNIYLYVKNKGKHKFIKQYMPRSEETEKRWKGKTIVASHGEEGERIPSDSTEEDSKGSPLNSVWYVPIVAPSGHERVGYPTQKPEALITKLMLGCTEEDDLIFDCFMGSGTTQVVALKSGRRFIGADINLASTQITTKRLLALLEGINSKDFFDKEKKYQGCGFEVLNVNNYEVFRNPIEAKSLILEALEIEALSGSVYDGEKDGFMVKVMPINRIATREDLNELIGNFPYKVFEQRKEENPSKPVESVMLVCMGHEPDLKAHLEQECGFKLNIEVVDILRDKTDIEFKRDSEAIISTKGNTLVVKNFFPMNLMQKLSLQKESVGEWRELVDQILIDWNYDGAAMEPTMVDIPEKDEFVQGEYAIPDDAGTIKIKITDLLSESYEEVIQYG